MESIINQARQKTEEYNPKLIRRDSPLNRETAEVDAELEAFIARQHATIKVVGCGGGGNNTINRMAEVGIAGAEMIAVKLNEYSRFAFPFSTQKSL